MLNNYLRARWAHLYALILAIFVASTTFGQIYAPEGLNMVGEVETPNWVNPPSANSPLGSEFQVTNGGMKRLTTGVKRWHATWQASSTGTQQFLFTSGPSGNPYNNKWANVTPVVFNSYQTYTFGGGTNNNINVTSGKYYTLNWEEKDPDNGGPNQFDGYINTQAVFMETDNAPITISGTSQTPIAANVTPLDPVEVVVNVSGSPSPQENIYVRYTTNSYATSSLVQASFSLGQWRATIPAQVDGTTIQYYAFTSTGSSVQIGTNYDMFTINSGGGSSYTSTASLPVSVTFQVDMANEVVSGAGVHIAGSFNSFNPGATQLTLVSGTVYAVTIPLVPNSTVQYKFINGNSWGTDETVPGACNVGGNREITITNADPQIIPLHCFAKCVACVPKVPVKFSVNMAGITIDGAGVHIAGDFGSAYPVWNPGGIALTNEGGGIYSTTLMLIPGNSYQYKYVNGNSWGKEEGVPGGCNVSGNRQITVPGSSYNVPTHCFGTCNNCVSVTFRVNMTGQTIGGGGVHVAGSFQGWNPGATALNFVGGGVYEVVVKMDQNTSFQYKFVNGNAWGDDESVPGVCQSGGNRFASVGTSNKVLPLVCFRRCIDCAETSNWTGAGDQNFNNGSNWTAGVAPNGCDFNLRIKAGVPQPILNGTATAGAVAFDNGTNLDIASGQLNICGAVSATGLSGISVSGSGKVVLNGSGAQTITGNASMANLEINNGSGVSLASNANLRILNSLKLQNGALNVSAGSLRFISSPTSEARLLKVESGATLVGNVSFQKHLPAIAPGKGAWFFMGAPVGGVELNEFAQGGNGFAPATFEAGNTNFASLYLYSQTNSALDNDFGWVKGGAANQVLGSGTGIRVWGRQTFLDQRGYYQFTGAPVVGNHNFTLGYCNSSCSNPTGGPTNGWNLLANPYPCPIDWNVLGGWSKTGIAGNAIYIWNADQEKYSTYDGSVGTFGGSKDIAAGQSFFVEASNASASLQVNENAKIDTYKPGMRAAVAEPSGIRIELTSNGQKDDVWLDLGLDRLNVAVSKMTNPGLNLALSNGAKSFAIAGQNTVETDGFIPLKIKGSLGAGTLSLTKTNDLSGFAIYLKDDYLGTLTELNEGETLVNFNSTANDDNRFYLVINQVQLSTNDLVNGKILKTWPNPVKDQLFIEFKGKARNYEILTVAGKAISSGRIESGQNAINTNGLPAGQYILRVEGQFGKFVKW